jgi:hypothetical protein
LTVKRRLIIDGPFTDAELAEFIALVRRIDAANPTAVYRMEIADPDGSTEEGERLLRAALPPQHDRMTEFARATFPGYLDDRYPKRECDRCGAQYRGPAVYCSLACAIADA